MGGSPRGGVERGEHEVLGQRARLREGVEERGLARVGVSHQGHHGVALSYIQTGVGMVVVQGID